jgi:chaperone BCS1
MANYLCFNLCDLDLSKVRLNSTLQKLLIHMPNKSMLVIEDIDYCFDDSAASTKAMKAPGQAEYRDMDPDYTSDSSDKTEPSRESLP